MNKKDISREQIEEIVKNSFTKAECIRRLDICKDIVNGYKFLNSKIRLYNLDTSHFTGYSHLKGKQHNTIKTKSLEEVLVENSTYNSNSGLKVKLLKNNILEYKCSVCGLDQWLDKPISLHLDHINGIFNDNRIENLRLLCPNCHSQTPTFGSKNKAYKDKSYLDKLHFNKLNNYKTNKCECGKLISTRSKRCNKCHKKTTFKIIWPSYAELKKMVEETSRVSVAKKLGVSDNAVKKRLMALSRIELD